MTSIITYKQMKSYYSEYLKEMSKKKINTNSRKDVFIRCSRELDILGTLIQIAKTEGSEQELKQFIQRQNALANVLKKMGFEVKLMDI